MNIIEKCCRKICDLENVDPDQLGHGFGHMMPRDAKYPLWFAREQKVKTVIKTLHQEGFIDVHIYNAIIKHWNEEYPDGAFK